MNKTSLLCLFGYHKFTIPIKTKRVSGNCALMLCENCERVSMSSWNTLYYVDKNKKVVAWQNENTHGKYVNGKWIAVI